MNWDNFVFYAFGAVVFWAAGALIAVPASGSAEARSTGAASFKSCCAALILTLCGSAVLLTFVIGLWFSLERPPMRTVGETRLWYSLFVSLSGAAVFLRWKYRWILPVTGLMSTVFVCVNLFKPEIHDKTLVPALQSAWFIPHVTVYMVAYALLGAAAVFGLYFWLRSAFRRTQIAVQPDQMQLCDNLVRTGWVFLTLGMIMGCLWAKQAWGDWWSWDPKETWAAATWLSYLLYMHIRKSRPEDYRTGFILIIFSFILLQMCWYGVNYLPSAKGISIHSY